MTREREAELVGLMQQQRTSLLGRLVVELLEGRREKLRDKLESEDSAENRGRCKEIKDILALLK
jgi:hypothetical protein